MIRLFGRERGGGEGRGTIPEIEPRKDFRNAQNKIALRIVIYCNLVDAEILTKGTCVDCIISVIHAIWKY